MKVKAELKNLRIAPRKTRLVADMVRGKKIEPAQALLGFAIKKGSAPILKLLNSALSSAKNDFQLEPSNLYISEITVDEGPKYKRWRPRSRGMAHGIQKKTSHIRIVLEEIVEGKKIKKTEKVEKKPEVKEEVKEKPKFEPERKKETPKLKDRKGIKKFFRRKSI